MPSPYILLSTFNIVKNIAYMSVVWVMRHMTVMTYLQWRSVTNDAWLGGTIRFWSSESNVFMMSTAAHLCSTEAGEYGPWISDTQPRYRDQHWTSTSTVKELNNE